MFLHLLPSYKNKLKYKCVFTSICCLVFPELHVELPLYTLQQIDQRPQTATHKSLPVRLREFQSTPS